MKISPIKLYHSPNYPSKDLFICNPHLFRNHIPSSWKEKTVVVSALAAFIICGCGTEKSTDSFTKTVQQQIQKGAQIQKHVEQNTIKKQSIKLQMKTDKKIHKNDSFSVAPLFIHGGGRGATGCVVIAPPVFITEEEARQIISEEMMKENIIISRTNVSIAEIAISKDKTMSAQTDKSSLTFDGLSDSGNIGYKYVTKENYSGLQVNYNSNISIQNYDFLHIAENLREKFPEYSGFTAVVFYDPCTAGKLEHDMTMMTKASRTLRSIRDNKLKAKSRELLKSQVRDFLKWMKINSKG
jgi:hypothetical protein